ncbi:MAG: TIGR00282 family metallophosphoesterase [bacterium]
MRILFIGDIVASLGRTTVSKILPNLIKDDNISLAIANGENLAHGRGLTAEKVSEVLGFGVDFLTTGDHVFRIPGFAGEIDSLPVIRPANWPQDTPGKGYHVLDLGKEGKVLLVNLLGTTHINGPTENPFYTIDKILEEFEKEKFKAIMVDFHAEVTSESRAFGFYVDGRVTAVFGTHSHVPTADAQILPNGTAYVTDVGMVGARDSVLGVEPQIIIDRFTKVPSQRFEWVEDGPSVFNSVLLEVDNKGKVASFERLDKEVGPAQILNPKF